MMRLVLDPAGCVWPDVLQKAPGRGAYLCMRPKCVQHLNDRALQQAWRIPSIAPKQAGTLFKRMQKELALFSQKLLGLQKSQIAMGREAVLHRLQNNRPVLVMLAMDAGKAVTRQITAALLEREKARLIRFPASGLLGAALGRGPVSVAAIETTAMATKLQRCCDWYIQLMESR